MKRYDRMSWVQVLKIVVVSSQSEALAKYGGRVFERLRQKLVQPDEPFPKHLGFHWDPGKGTLE